MIESAVIYLKILYFQHSPHNAFIVTN